MVIVKSCRYTHPEIGPIYVRVNANSRCIRARWVGPELHITIPRNLPADEYEALWSFARRVAAAIEKAIPCKRVGVAVMGLEVPHAHIHLMPLNSEGDMDFKNKLQIPAGQMQAIADAIAANFE